MNIPVLGLVRPLRSLIRRNVHCLVISLFVVLVIFNSHHYLTGIGVQENGNLSLAYHLYHNKTFGFEENDKTIAPSNYREPGYPSFLSFVMAINPLTDETLSLREFKKNEDQILYLKYSNVVILVILSMLSMHFISDFTGNKNYGYIGLFMVGLSMSLNNIANSFESELMQALLLLCVSGTLYRMSKKATLGHFIALAVFVGSLSLVRAVFAYFALIIIIIGGYKAYKSRNDNNKNLAGVITFAVITSLIIGSWTLRNYHYFGDANITVRGGVVLLVRAKKNMMNISEYLGSFWYWALDGALVKFVNGNIDGFPNDGVIVGVYKIGNSIMSFVDKGIDQKGGMLERLNRNNETSFLVMGISEWTALIAKYNGGQKAVRLADKECLRIAINEIEAHPIRHILATFPFIWRGSFVEHIYRGNYSIVLEILNVTLLCISLLYFPALAFLLFISLKMKNPALICFVLPSLYLFGFHSLFTHNLPRYNTPLIPVLVCSLLIAVHLITVGCRQRKLEQELA